MIKSRLLDLAFQDSAIKSRALKMTVKNQRPAVWQSGTKKLTECYSVLCLKLDPGSNVQENKKLAASTDMFTID